jgi:2-polyprenyl-3-methyl-5-hydroxy-6-metoxy-1,4-benzoquinol methylase
MKGRYMIENQNHTTGIRSKQLVDQIASAQIRLYDKLIHLDIESLNISEYNQRYLERKIASIRDILQLYGRLLYLSLHNSPILLENFVLVDYGGGTGLISFLAVEMGIGTVIYNDIYDVSCMDVSRLSNILGLTLDHIVCGDVDELISYLRENSISINAIISYDVLEHIYDVESHFRKLSSLSESQFRVVYASTANIANPRRVHLIKKTQIEVEYKNREKKWGHKERDSLQAYLEVRKNIISSYAPDLSSEQVEELARFTRGLIQRDIEKCVDEYRRQGSIAYRPDHPTNTCDPYTGNWCEHLMNFGWLKQILKNEGFLVEIMPGRYNISGSLLKKSIKLFLNAVIRLLGRWGMFAAPYYIVYAYFPAKQIAAPDHQQRG